MGATQFKRAELEDQEIISHYFEHHTSRSCERTFANVYLWSRQYPVKWAIIKNALVFKSEDENHVSFAYPAGAPEDVKNALEEMMEYSKAKGRPFLMYNVTPEYFAQLEEWYPGRFQWKIHSDHRVKEHTAWKPLLCETCGCGCYHIRRYKISSDRSFGRL